MRIAPPPHPLTSAHDPPEKDYWAKRSVFKVLFGGFNDLSQMNKALVCMCLCVHVCSGLSDSLRPHGLYPLGSSVHEGSQARILEWVAISSSRGSS